MPDLDLMGFFQEHHFQTEDTRNIFPCLGFRDGNSF